MFHAVRTASIQQNIHLETIKKRCDKKGDIIEKSKTKGGESTISKKVRAKRKTKKEEKKHRGIKPDSNTSHPFERTCLALNTADRNLSPCLNP